MANEYGTSMVQYGTKWTDFILFGVCLYGTGMVQVWYNKHSFLSLNKENITCTILVRLARPISEIFQIHWKEV